ncbi:MAG: hypothetical protein WCY64_08590, partial [Candidatus Cloacimonadaceae bacterium]
YHSYLLDDNGQLILLPSSGETEAGSAGEQPARDNRKQNELDKWSMADELCSSSSFWIMPKKTQKTVRYFRILQGVHPLPNSAQHAQLERSESQPLCKANTQLAPWRLSTLAQQA